MEPIIQVKNIGKKYKITHRRAGYVTLRDTLTNIFKSPFSFLKYKTKEIVGLDKKEEIWALKEINFTAEKGEVIGIIGRNGAGKSTLLKILSQITPPTTGEIRINGTVGSLLEVGTGFHPELTGRENILLNGAILGMQKKEIVEKFDDIVKFAGVEKFIDTPVKYYSSGMYVRLAFSVAAHMETDILIVDEVLAVGDADFQKKCLGKMEEITRKEGRTILFVSHNMTLIKQLCKKTILLSKGKIKKAGQTDEVIKEYLEGRMGEKEEYTPQSIHPKNITNMTGTRFTSIEISSTEGHRTLKSDDKLKIALTYESEKQDLIVNPKVVITVTRELSKNVVLRLDSGVTEHTLEEKINPNGKIVCETKDRINLTDGTYIVDIDFIIEGTSVNYLQGIGKFNVETDLKKYNYKNYPDTNVCDVVIPFEFK